MPWVVHCMHMRPAQLTATHPPIRRTKIAMCAVDLSCAPERMMSERDHGVGERAVAFACSMAARLC